MKKTLILACLAALTHFGCSDDKDKINEPDCTHGQTKCEDTTLSTCVDGSWQARACDKGTRCSANQCMATCNAGDIKCNGLAVMACSENLSWVQTQLCADQCVDGTCRNHEECTQNNFEPYCLNEEMLAAACSNSGQLTKTHCAYGCRDGRCQEPSGTCSEDNFTATCIEGTNSLLVCENNELTTKSCSSTEICSDGKCQKPSDTCSEDNFTATCVEGTNSLLVCVNSELTVKPCSSPEICSDGKCRLPSDFCLEDEFTATCIDKYTIRVCVDNKITVNVCPNNEICVQEGGASALCIKSTEEPACDKDDLWTCADDKTLKSCGRDGKPKYTTCWGDEKCRTFEEYGEYWSDCASQCTRDIYAKFYCSNVNGKALSIYGECYAVVEETGAYYAFPIYYEDTCTKSCNAATGECN